MERNAVGRRVLGPAVALGALLDFDAIGIVRTDLVQRDDVGRHEAEQHERQGDHVEGEETIQRRIADRIVTADPHSELRPDERHGGEQVDDHLRTPEAHLPPRQQVAKEGLGHEREVDQAAEDPYQFARLAVAAVHEPAAHVQVDHHKEHRGAGGVHVADDPTVVDIAHDELDRTERVIRVRLVVHREEDAGDDLDHQHQHGERAEVIPEVEILRGVVLGQVVPHEGRERESLIDPLHQRALEQARTFVGGCHDAQASLPSGLMPITTRVPSILCGGTGRLVGAGEPVKTRPAKSNFEPWHGQ